MTMSIFLRSRLPAALRQATPASRTLRYASSNANDQPGLRDPWILPAQIDPADSASSQDPVTYTPHPLDGSRDSFEELSTLRSRLVYQTRKRGTLETGLLLSGFATSDRIQKWNEEELKELDRLLAIPEWTIYYWAVGKQSPPEGSEWQTSKILGTSTSLVLPILYIVVLILSLPAELKEFSKNTERETRSMPELPH